MTVATVHPPDWRRLAIPPEPALPLTVEQYHAMIRAGALESGEPLEFLEGWLIAQPSANGDRPVYETRQVFRSGDRVPVVLYGERVGEIPAADLLP